MQFISIKKLPMKRLSLLSALILFPLIVFGAGYIQDRDVATLAQITGAGGTASQLINDTKIYVTAGARNEQLSTALGNGDIGTVSTVGTLDGQTASTNGIVISGKSIYAQSATATDPGMVTIGSQTFAGAKTFTGAVSANGLTDSAVSTAGPALFSAAGLLSSGTYSGNTTKLATTTGVLTSGDCVKLDVSGNFIDAGAACGAGGGGTGTVNSGTLGQMAYYAGTGTAVSGSADATLSAGALTLGVAGSAAGSLVISGSTSGAVSIKPQAAAGTYNFNLPIGAGSAGDPLLSGGGGTSPMTFGSLSGNTSIFATTNGVLTSGDCIKVDASGNLVDSGAACGTGAAIVFADSVVNTAGTVTLVNDTATPGSSKYYGTDGASALGYHAFPASTIAQVNSVSGSAASPTAVSAAGGIPATASIPFQTWFIQGSGGPVTITAIPQISAGTIGQQLTACGESNTNTVTFSNGNGLVMNGAKTLGAGDCDRWIYDGTNWQELPMN